MANRKKISLISLNQLDLKITNTGISIFAREALVPDNKQDHEYAAKDNKRSHNREN